MNFTFNGMMVKELWSGPASKLYLFRESGFTKDWAIFCKEELALGAYYKIDGYVSKAMSKKYFDKNNKAGSDYSFNAENIIATSMSGDIQDPPKLANQDEVPF